MTADFNPRSREGSDARGPSSTARKGYFNPRSREGSDGAYQDSERLISYFNPRSREGSDLLERVEVRRGVISIHAPVKGATTTADQS